MLSKDSFRLDNFLTRMGLFILVFYYTEKMGYMYQASGTLDYPMVATYKLKYPPIKTPMLIIILLVVKMICIGVLMSGVFGVVGWGRGVVGGTRSSVHVPGLFSVITTLATVTSEKYK